MLKAVQISTATLGVAFIQLAIYIMREDATGGTESRTVAVKHRTLSAWTSFANLATWTMLHQCTSAEAIVMVMGNLPFK